MSTSSTSYIHKKLHLYLNCTFLYTIIERQIDLMLTVNLNQFLMNINGQGVRDNPANRQCLMNITGTCCTIVELAEVDEGAS